jgi:hypothetical protein
METVCPVHNFNAVEIRKSGNGYSLSEQEAASFARDSVHQNLASNFPCTLSFLIQYDYQN